MKRPLEGLLVLEFCQFLAGPLAGLKLADLGARVIKIERPLKGEACRQLAIKNLFVEKDSFLFHTINRNKESYAADLKNPADLENVKKLIAKADIMTHNFRPGVMEKIGLDFESVKQVNPKIIYGVVSGYGNKGPWANKPGQDLLVQSLSGLTQLTGTQNDGPVPFGLSVADTMCGNHLVQGLLAGLLKRAKTGKGVLVEVSLLESTLDLQFEVLTTYLNDGGKLPQRSAVRGNGHAYLSAPYGLYQTNDGYLALAMGNLPVIASAIGCNVSKHYTESAQWFEKRDEIGTLFAEIILQKNTSEWLSILENAGIWCSPVLNYQEVFEQNAVKQAGVIQTLAVGENLEIRTTRSPIKINEANLYSAKAAPKVGADNIVLSEEFNLKSI